MKWGGGVVSSMFPLRKLVEMSFLYTTSIHIIETMKRQTSTVQYCI